MSGTQLTEFDVQAWLVRFRRLARHAWQHYREDRCFEEAASLGYTSLLALVPLLAVVFGIVSAFPVFRDWSEQIKSFLFSHLVPAAGEQVEAHLNNFLDSVTGLTLPGTVVLILTALLLMSQIEVAFNRVWRVDRPRSFTNRVVMYWAVLTLAPLLIGAAIAISVQEVIAPLEIGTEIANAWYRVGVFVLSWLVFTLMFALVPNRGVRFRDAAAGALLSAVLFELAKVGFVAYVTNANYAVIYGALATVPIFLMWLYLVWAVTLLGASLSASLTTFDDTEERRGDWPAKANFQLVYRLMAHLHDAQARGERLTQAQLLQLEPRAGERQMLELLRQLEQATLITRVDEDAWVLARDLDEVSLADLYRSGNYYLPVGDSRAVVIETAWDRALAGTLAEIGGADTIGLGRSLKSMYRPLPGSPA